MIVRNDALDNVVQTRCFSALQIAVQARLKFAHSLELSPVSRDFESSARNNFDAYREVHSEYTEKNRIIPPVGFSWSDTRFFPSIAKSCMLSQFSTSCFYKITKRGLK